MDVSITDLAEQLAGADPMASIWGVCQLARAALPLLGGDQGHPQRAIEAAEAWLSGGATSGDCMDAARVLSEHMRTLRGGHRYRLRALQSASFAAFAASWGPGHDRFVFAVRGAAEGAHAALYSYGCEHSSSEPPHVWQRAHALLPAVLRTQRWSRVRPTAAQLQRAPPAVAVAWDAVAHSRAEHTIGALLEARARAERLGLDWAEPVQRAVAEHARDEEQLRVLLGPGGR